MCADSTLHDEAPITRLTEEARGLISEFGGASGQIRQVSQSRSYVVCCEVGLFRFSEQFGVEWRTPCLGVIDSCSMTDDELVIDVGGGSMRLSLSSGLAR